MLPTSSTSPVPDASFLTSFITVFINITIDLIPIFIVLAFIVFVWGLIIFILNSGKIDAVADGKRKMLWGIIALFVIISVWGILVFMQTIIGIDTISTTSVNPPAIPK